VRVIVGSTTIDLEKRLSGEDANILDLREGSHGWFDDVLVLGLNIYTLYVKEKGTSRPIANLA
jgi:hypothetical protein